jgi:hypothetical protein
MTENSGSKPPRSFFLIGGVALVWNLLGIGAYISQVTMSPDALNVLPDAERALYENIPAWATAAYAIAVNAGALGCLLLLFRKALATPVLIISLAAVLVQMYHAIFVVNALDVYGAPGAVMPIAIIIIGAYLVWFSIESKKKGWIS